MCIRDSEDAEEEEEEEEVLGFEGAGVVEVGADSFCPSKMLRKKRRWKMFWVLM